MKNIVWGGVVFALTTISHSADIPDVLVNCDDVKLSINTIRDNRFNFSAYWNEPTVFPETPKYIEVGDTLRSKQKRFKFSCPNFSVMYDGNIAEIKAKNYNDVLSHISEFDYDVWLYSYSWYKYKNKREGFMHVGYAFNVKTFSLNKDLNYDNAPKEAIVGYKIDSGEFKPLLFHRTISYHKDDFEKANVIDIYNNYPNDTFMIGETLERIHIDKINGILRFYRNYPFPKN